MRAVIQKTLIAAGLITGLSSVAFGQHPIDVERKTASGEHLQALSVYDSVPQRRATTASVIAAARSSWALSLPERAAVEFDKALRDPTLSPVQRGRLLLSRGVIEFQENRQQVAAVFAEKAVEVLTEAGPLRAQAYALWADSLMKTGRPGEAEARFTQSISESGAEERISITFKRGECRMSLGLLDEAASDFESVPLSHEHAPAAMRNLAQVAMEQKKFKQAAFWLEKGRENFPDSFLDSWVDYALVSVAAGQHDGEKVERLRAEARKKYAPSDYWFALLDSAAEAYLWSESKGTENSEMMAMPKSGI